MRRDNISNSMIAFGSVDLKGAVAVVGLRLLDSPVDCCIVVDLWSQAESMNGLDYSDLYCNFAAAAAAGRRMEKTVHCSS